MDGGDPKNGTHEPLAGALFYILLGPIVWAIHLTLVYLGHTLLCALGVSSGALAPGVVSISVIIVTAALIVLIVAVVVANFRRRAFNDRGVGTMLFREKIMMGLALLSGFAVWTLNCLTSQRRSERFLSVRARLFLEESQPAQQQCED